MIKVAFFGTSEFAAASLKRLLDSQYAPGLIFTKPDSPQGRGQKLAFSPVKAISIQAEIKTLQPQTLRDDAAFDAIREYAPDVIAVAAYGLFLPKRYLELARCINVHGSLLPGYRGAAPIQRAIMDGVSEIGVCTMNMVSKMDAGDVLLSAKFPLSGDEIFPEVHDKLAAMGAELLIETLDNLPNIKPVPQDENLVTFAPPIDKSEREIDASLPAIKIHNKIRAMYPNAALGGYKLCRSSLDASASPITLVCGDGEKIAVTEIQAPGKKRMNAVDFLRGNPKFSLEVK